MSNHKPTLNHNENTCTYAFFLIRLMKWVRFILKGLSVGAFKRVASFHIYIRCNFF